MRNKKYRYRQQVQRLPAYTGIFLLIYLEPIVQYQSISEFPDVFSYLDSHLQRAQLPRIYSAVRLVIHGLPLINQ